MKSIFISFEGIEGSGKSTQVRRLAKTFRDQGLKVLETREPGGTKLGNQLREILLEKQEYSLSSKTELMLMQAARAQHVEEVLKPALSSYDLILCDRYMDASTAYQGAGRDLGVTWVEALNQMIVDKIVPHRTLLFDIAPQVALERAFQRIQKRTKNKEDRFESETIRFHEKVRNEYLAIAKRNPNRVFIILAHLSFDEVYAQALSAIEDVLP